MSTALSTRSSRFELAPPRRFVLPAILLLLSERPSHGYNLQKGLETFRLGHIDRPTTYRALAQLERDGLVESWTEAPKAGQARRVYGVTPLGEQVLRVWMSIVREERDCLGRVLRRYERRSVVDVPLEATEAALAFVACGLPITLPEPRTHRRLNSVNAGSDPYGGMGPDECGGAEVERDDAAMIASQRRPRRFRLVPDRSVVLIEVRSSAGPVSFGAIGLVGEITANVAGNAIDLGGGPATARIELAMADLRSGNRVYDAELLRRIDARRFPLATLELGHCVAAGERDRYRLNGVLTFHGVTRAVDGTVEVAARPEGGLVITGEQVFDVRDFDVPSPTVLMLRFYPDVRVRLQVEAEPLEV